MTKISSKLLLADLQSDVRDILLQCDQLLKQPKSLLSQKPDDGGWSIAQVLEHLNIYSNYYHQAIEKNLHRNQRRHSDVFFPGWLGGYFTRLMKPREDGSLVKKMKSPENAQASLFPNGTAQLDVCIRHQHELLNLLKISENADINSIRIPTSLNKMIRLKLGDTFSFLVAHQQRHFLQIRRILTETSIDVVEVRA